MGDNMARDSKVGNKDNDLSRLRLAFFPIYDSELSQFIPMCGLVFFTIFAFHLLRSIKDPLITTAPGSSVEVLSFLKIYLVLPITILSSILYMRLRRSYGLYDAYNLIIGVFISFFFIFAVFIYLITFLVATPVHHLAVRLIILPLIILSFYLGNKKIST